MRGAVVVLAAGASSRMGRPKADLPYLGGSFLSVVLERLRVVEADWLRVVVAPGRELPGALLNPDPAAGPIRSIQEALRAGALEEPWLLVARVDYPAVQASTYAALARAARAGAGDLWVPTSGGRRGHPVVFGQACYEDLLRVPPGQGARWVARRHAGRRVEVPVEDPAIHWNIDTPEDYTRLLRHC